MYLSPSRYCSKELQSIGLDVKILNEDQEEVVMKELDDEDEVVETGIEEVMEGSAVETDEVTVVEERKHLLITAVKTISLANWRSQWAIPLTMKTKTIYKEGSDSSARRK